MSGARPRPGMLGARPAPQDPMERLPRPDMLRDTVAEILDPCETTRAVPPATDGGPEGEAVREVSDEADSAATHPGGGDHSSPSNRQKLIDRYTRAHDVLSAALDNIDAVSR